MLEVPPIVPAFLRARSAWRPGRASRAIRTRGPACVRDGLVLADHPACLACGILAGAAHPLCPLLADGLCPSCAVG